MFYFIIYSLILLWLLWYIFLKTDPRPIGGIYCQPGKWFLLKFCIFYAVFKLRQWKIVSRPGCTTSINAAGYGVKSKSNTFEMDAVQNLPADQPKAVDAVYFNGSNLDGVYLVAATARRQKSLTQAMLLIHLPDLGILELPCAPDTHLYDSKPNSFAAGGLEITPLEPMKKWRIQYEGNVKVNGEDFGDIELNLNWTACTDYFDYDTDMSPIALGKAVALESWSQAFFHRLRTAHQTHYEQFGDFTGYVLIKNQMKKIPLELRGIRDHSYGSVRDWKHFHRYGFHFFHLEDGTCVHAGVVSMPNVLFSRLELGFLCSPNGQTLPIDQGQSTYITSLF